MGTFPLYHWTAVGGGLPMTSHSSSTFCPADTLTTRPVVWLTSIQS